MPRIKMSIDLEIEDGLFIKISSSSAVSIHAERAQAEEQTLQTAEQPIMAFTRASGWKQDRNRDSRIRRILFTQEQEFSISTLFTSAADRTMAYRIAKKAVSAGTLLITRPTKNLGKSKGTIAATYKVV